MRQYQPSYPRPHYANNKAAMRSLSSKNKKFQTSFQRDHHFFNYMNEHPILMWILILFIMPLASILAVAAITSLFSLLLSLIIL